ncbi:MAG: Holliday junction branch migration protein RuvA [Eubacteriales bacterium]|nr:Holliday junction branch migration protein RuvA [Eubacteriales bacterium]
MYAFIRGRLHSRNLESLVIENQGIGYLIRMPERLQSALPAVGSEVFVYLYEYVRENIHELYGFASLEEKEMFLNLITVTGIGPSTALAVLDALSPDRFAAAILHEDHKLLAKAKGIGKRSAERIVLELRDKLKKSNWAEMDFEVQDAAEVETSSSDGPFSEVLEALLVLGFRPAEAENLLKESYQTELSLEENIRRALAVRGSTIA